MAGVRKPEVAAPNGPAYHVAGSPWTPRITHLRRPNMRSAPALPTVHASPPLSHSSSSSSLEGGAPKPRGSASGVLSNESDGTPVWPYYWNRDPHSRSKYR